MHNVCIYFLKLLFSRTTPSGVFSYRAMVKCKSASTSAAVGFGCEARVRGEGDQVIFCFSSF